MQSVVCTLPAQSLTPYSKLEWSLPNPDVVKLNIVPIDGHTVWRIISRKHCWSLKEFVVYSSRTLKVTTRLVTRHLVTESLWFKNYNGIKWAFRQFIKLLARPPILPVKENDLVSFPNKKGDLFIAKHSLRRIYKMKICLFLLVYVIMSNFSNWCEHKTWKRKDKKRENHRSAGQCIFEPLNGKINHNLITWNHNSFLFLLPLWV